jgi:hypothetical protein
MIVPTAVRVSTGQEHAITATLVESAEVACIEDKKQKKN